MKDKVIDQITCPNCGHGFDVEDVLASKVEEQLKKKFTAEKVALEQRFKEKNESLQKQQLAFEEAKKKENELFANRLKQALAREKEDLDKKLAQDREAQLGKLKEEFDAQIKSQAKEIEEKRTQLRALREKEIELARVKHQLKEQEDEIKLKLEKDFLERQSELEEKARKRERENFELERIKLQKQIDDQKKLAEEMKRKAEQGSMQLQGEVQEIALEDTLRNAFPFDILSEVKKGARGADCVLTVKNEMQQECGSIIFESKRTKSFVTDWVDKLKNDQRVTGAEIAVIVTEAMPKEMDRFGEFNGVYVCQYHDTESLVYVLRQMLIQNHHIRMSQENKGDKMEVLYDFLTGTEFSNRITAIADSFQNMNNDLIREKRAMESLWKKREKQIQIITDNTISLHASVKGIGGKSIPSIEIFELPDGDL